MKDKVVVITGASGGIGAALSEVFASQGSFVVMAARNVSQLEEVNGMLASPESHLRVRCDVSQESDCKHLIDEAVRRYGRIDVLINNAGISMRALLEDADLEVIRKVMAINFWGTVYCTKYALPWLLQTSGSLVGISSIAGKAGLPGRTGYSASKFAMEGFLESVRTENLHRGLHVLVACPGFTSTNIRNTALNAAGQQQGESPRNEKSMMTPTEVASRIYDAVVHRKRDLLLTREGKLTVLLKKFFPSSLDRMIYNHMAKEKDSPFRK